jgi:hypothetical protein
MEIPEKKYQKNIDKIYHFLIIKVPDCFLLTVELNAVTFNGGLVFEN